MFSYQQDKSDTWILIFCPYDKNKMSQKERIPPIISHLGSPNKI